MAVQPNRKHGTVQRSNGGAQSKVTRLPMSHQGKDQEPWNNLLEQVGSNQDQQSFAQLFQHYAPLIKAFALHSGLERSVSAQADELVQEVMTLVWRKAHTFDRAKASATTWIFTIARNARIDLYRRLSRHQTELTADDLWFEEQTEGPINNLQQHSAEQQIRKGMDTLPHEQKEALTKVFLEDKTHQQVAEELGLPLGTVKSRIRLAMQKMKISLENTEL